VAPIVENIVNNLTDAAANLSSGSQVVNDNDSVFKFDVADDDTGIKAAPTPLVGEGIMFEAAESW